MPKIFISYRRADSSGYVGRLFDHLSKHFGDNQVFMDIDAIPLGVDFAQYIEEEVSTCNILIAVIGNQWLNISDVKTGERRLDKPGDFVRLEIATALRRGIPVIPLLIQGAKMPEDETQLPDDLKNLLRRNALELYDRYFIQGVEELIDGIKKVLVKTKTSAESSPSSVMTPSAEPSQPIAPQFPPPSTPPLIKSSPIQISETAKPVIKLTTVLGIETEIEVSVISQPDSILSTLGTIKVEIASGVYIVTPLSDFREAHRSPNGKDLVLFSDGYEVSGALGGSVIGTDKRKYQLEDATDIELVGLPNQTNRVAQDIDPSGEWLLQFAPPIDTAYTGVNPHFRIRRGEAHYSLAGTATNHEYIDSPNTFHMNINNRDVQVNFADFEAISFFGTKPPSVKLITAAKKEITGELKVKDSKNQNQFAWYLVLKLKDSQRYIAIKPPSSVTLNKKLD